MTADFGRCQVCGKPAVVGLNGAKLCLEHFKARLAAVRRVIEGLDIWGTA
jgi:hypothetical protein